MNKIESDILGSLVLALPSLREHHYSKSKVYRMMKQVAHREIEARFHKTDLRVEQFKPFGDLIFQYHKMGAIDSLDLFNLDELIIFSFYWTNRKRYRRVLDMGANIGLHSIILNRCGFDVFAFEPDPQHLKILRRNLILNECRNIRVCDAAVSDKNGVQEFVRVLGNTTSNHLAGSKLKPYGDLERFSVKTQAIKPLMHGADLMKIDVEGHERQILLATNADDWVDTDALVEVESKINAIRIYEHFINLKGVRLFSQKIGWQRIRMVYDMPMSYHEGTMFITCKTSMPWQE